MKRLIGLLLLLVFVAPPASLVSVAAIINPAAISCGSGSLLLSAIPDSLTAKTRDGGSITLNRRQLKHAATIISIGSGTTGVGREGVVIALMAALTESSLRMLANPSAHPESMSYPNDGVGTGNGRTYEAASVRT